MYQIHRKYLDYLSNNLDVLGLDKMDEVLVEPEWRNSQNQIVSLCDLIAINSQQAIPIELKQSQIKRQKAIKQIRKGLEFIEDELQLTPSNYGFFVRYDSTKTLDMNPYKFEKLEF